MTHIFWPRKILCGLQKSFDPVYRTASGGIGPNGFGTIVASDAGGWTATFAGIPVLQNARHDRIILWRAIDALLDGRAGTIAMPLTVRGRRPLPDGVTDNMIDSDDGVDHDDDTEFDDGSNYEQNWIGVSVSENASLRATTLALTKTACGDLEPGMDFSIGVRAYRIKKVLEQDDGSAVVVVNFPLREAVAAGKEVNFDHPVCLMRLASDDEMALPIDMNRRAISTIRFVEAL